MSSSSIPAPGVDTAALLRLSAFASMTSMRVCDSLTAPLANEFLVAPTEAAHTISFFAIAYGLMQMFYGPWSDRIGKTRVIGLATAGCAVANFCVLFAPTMPSVLVLRALSGAFAAGIIPISLAYVGDTVVYEQRQPALAKFLTATLTGMICGQWLGGVLADAVSWRAPFLVVCLLFIVAAVMMTRAGLLVGKPPAAAGGAGGAKLPYFRQVGQILSRPWARLVLLITFIEGATAVSIFALVPTHLNQRFGLSMSAAGAMLALYGLGGLVYAVTAPHLVRRLGERGLSVVGGSLLGVGFLLMAIETWAWLAAPACLLGGLGMYMLHNTLQTHATQLSSDYRGTGVSIFASCLFVGQSVGVTIAAALVGAGHTRLLFVFCALATTSLGLVFAGALKRRAIRSSIS